MIFPGKYLWHIAESDNSNNSQNNYNNNYN